MADNPRLTALAEAVADGDTPDWSAAQRAALDIPERRAIDGLRAVQTIHTLFTVGSSRRPVTRRLLQSGDKWAALEIRAHIGCGRFGDVYRAWDPALEREVALKLVEQGDAGERDRRVVTEARLMARVRHPNVLTIHGACRIDEVNGLWMELVDGRTLEQELAARGPFPEAEIIRIGIDLAGAVTAVHTAGLVHRDVKAQNVMRDGSGRIVLGDFGTGRETDEPEEARTGLVGTPAYLAPEIFERQSATAQSDIYSLGTLLFHLATVQYPVAGGSLRAVRDAHALGKRTPLATLRPELSPRLVAVIERALEPEPTKRFARASEMAAALEAILNGHSRQSVGVRVIGIVVVAVVVLALGVAAAQRRWTQATAPFADAVETSSPRALELYRQAKQLAGEGGIGLQRPQLVEQMLRAALEEDPRFVMAHVMLAHALFAQPDRATQALAQMEHAVAVAAMSNDLDQQVAQAELYGMRAQLAHGPERRRLNEEAAAAFEAALRIQPDHEWSLACLNNIYAVLGRHQQSLNAATGLVALRPQSVTALWRAARAARAAQAFDLATQYGNRAIASDELIDERNAFQAAEVRSIMVHSAWVDGDMRGASAIVDTSLALLGRIPATARPSFAIASVSGAMTVGRLEDARRLAELMSDNQVRGSALARALNPTYGRELLRDERERLGAVIAQYFPNDAAAIFVVPLFIDAGRIADARRVAAVLAPSPQTSLPYVNLVRAELLHIDRRFDEVIALLEAPDRLPPAGSNPWVRSRLLLSDALVATGQVERAVEILRVASDRAMYTLESAPGWFVVRSRLADLHRELGQSAAATPIDTELRELLEAADRDHPVVRKLLRR
jgi:tetratricopeptide (TPR) repeat protein